jgi:hypothetical protein
MATRAASKRAALIALVGLTTTVAAACTAQHPAELVGDISGTVQYHGTALAQTPTPVLIVGAFAYQPSFLDGIAAGQRPVPHAAFYVQNPDFGTTGIAYRLSKLQAFDQGYFVTGVILNEMDVAVPPAATGLYPDMSIMVIHPPVGPVMVAAEETLAGIDFELSDYTSRAP